MVHCIKSYFLCWLKTSYDVRFGSVHLLTYAYFLFRYEYFVPIEKIVDDILMKYFVVIINAFDALNIMMGTTFLAIYK